MAIEFRTQRIIVLNGPSKVGKDFIGQELISNMITPNGICMKFATPMKAAVRELMGYGSPWDDWFEKNKDEETFECWENTARSLYIWMSEVCAKPKFGNDFFGVNLLRRMAKIRDYYDTFVITDSGFVEELIPILKAFKKENILLVKLARQGVEYKSNDSRKYITLTNEDIRQVNYDNDNPNTVERRAELLALLPDHFKCF